MESRYSFSAVDSEASRPDNLCRPSISRKVRSPPVIWSRIESWMLQPSLRPEKGVSIEADYSSTDFLPSLQCRMYLHFYLVQVPPHWPVWARMTRNRIPALMQHCHFLTQQVNVLE